MCHESIVISIISVQVHGTSYDINEICFFNYFQQSGIGDSSVWCVFRGIRACVSEKMNIFLQTLPLSLTKDPFLGDKVISEPNKRIGILHEKK